MKKPIAVVAIIGLAIGLTWAAEQVGGWLGFAQQETGEVRDDNPGAEDIAGSEGVPPSDDSAVETQAQSDGDTGSLPELSEEVASIEEDLARIEEALENEEVLEEFTPSEPLSADNPVPWPTDI